MLASSSVANVDLLGQAGEVAGLLAETFYLGPCTVRSVTSNYIINCWTISNIDQWLSFVCFFFFVGGGGLVFGATGLCPASRTRAPRDALALRAVVIHQLSWPSGALSFVIRNLIFRVLTYLSSFLYPTPKTSPNTDPEDGGFAHIWLSLWWLAAEKWIGRQRQYSKVTK